MSNQNSVVEPQGKKLTFRKEKVAENFIDVDARLLVTEVGFNIRYEYGNIEELGNNMLSRGHLIPILAYEYKIKKGEELIDGTFASKDMDGYRVYDGHRRYKALQYAKTKDAKKFLTIRIGVVEVTEKEKLLAMYSANMHKACTPLENANLYYRLNNAPFSMSVNQIVEELQIKSPQLVSMGIKMAKAPDYILGYIMDNIISYNKAKEYFQGYGEKWDKAGPEIKKLIDEHTKKTQAVASASATSVAVIVSPDGSNEAVNPNSVEKKETSVDGKGHHKNSKVSYINKDEIRKSMKSSSSVSKPKTKEEQKVSSEAETNTMVNRMKFLTEYIIKNKYDTDNDVFKLLVQIGKPSEQYRMADVVEIYSKLTTTEVEAKE